MIDFDAPADRAVPSSPADRLRHAYAQWHETRGASGQLFIDLMADDIEMHSVLDPETAPDPLARPRRGKAEALEYLEVLARDWEMIGYPTHRIVADGDTVVWIGRCQWRHRATGNMIDTPKVDIWSFRNGQAVSFLEMFDSLGFALTSGLR